MRNNGKTSVIDCEGYSSTFNMILSPMMRSLASHDRHGGGLSNRGGNDEGHWRCGGAQGGS
jgi:hypothetical protein